MNKRKMTSEESFEALNKVQEQINSRYLSYEEREELEKLKSEAIKNLVPRSGLGCTVCFYSDRRAATIARVVSPTKVVISFNQVVCKDYYAGEYEILPMCDDSERVFTKRRNGKWIEEGQQTKDGVQLMLHYQDHYIDPTF